MKIEELLQACLKSKPLRVQLLKGKGHEHRGNAAGIPQSKPLRMRLEKRERA